MKRCTRWIAVAGLALLSGCERPGTLAPAPPRQEAPAARTPPAPAAPSPEIAAMEAEIVRRINQIRRERDLPALRSNDQLARVARDYSRQMAREDFFSHTSPSGGTADDRVRAAGLRFSLLGENIFKSVNAPKPAPLAVQGWMQSKGHRENILRKGFNETGVGVWREGNTYYITQLFQRPL